MAGFGPPLIDFSPLANLGKTFFDAQDRGIKRQESELKRQTLASLGQDFQAGNFGGAAQKLAALGELGGAAQVYGLGQKMKESAREEEWLRSNSGILGGSPAAPSAPSAPSVESSGGPASLIQNESGGNWQAQNNAVGAGGQRGHFGRLQFGQARIQEAAAAGAIPPGTTPQAFMQSPELQQRAEAWHWSDIDNHIRQTGLDRAVGQTINGVPVTVEGMRAVAHLGGKKGLSQFIETGGRYNPADENGTRLSDYFARHGGSGGTQVASPVALVQRAPLAPPGVQVAQNEADVQRLEAQMPGFGGGAPAVASIAGDDPIKLRQEAARYQQSNPEAARQFLARADAAERGAGTQMAQAPAADLPAPGAAPAQGFAIPGAAQADPSISNDPRVVNLQRALAGAPDKFKPAIQSRLNILVEELKQARTDSKLLSPEQEAQKIRLAQAGRTQINNTNAFDAKGESKFNEALGAAQAKRWNGYIEEGDVAQNRIADIQTLREASRRLGSQGSSANLKATIGPYAESLGIKVEGLSDIQLYESITNRLAPTLRAAGSGSTSDIEFKGFQRAIGPLSNTPAAREMILDTFEAASRNDLARSEIASRLAEGQINRGQAEKEIRALPNPLEGFKKYREANPDEVGRALKEAAMQQAADKREPAKVASPDDYSKLKTGDKFIDPDGNVRTKR